MKSNRKSDANCIVTAKAFSAALGDEAKTKAVYIQIRVDQLREQLAAELQQRSEQEDQMAAERASHGPPTIAVSTRWDFWTGTKLVITNTGERTVHLQSCVITDSRGGDRSCIRSARTIAPHQTIEVSGSLGTGERITFTCAGFARPLSLNQNELFGGAEGQR